MIEQIKNPPPLEYTRTQLIQLARERGLRGYSRLRKYQLLQKLIGNEDQILNQENDARMANVPFFTPTPYTPPQTTPSSSSSSNVPFLTQTPYTPPEATPSSSSFSNDVKDLIDYLNKATKRPKNLSYRSISELQRLLKLNKLRKEIDDISERMKIFEVKESDSALRNFARVYTIDGKLGFDPQSSLDSARENMIRVLRDNRNTKVKLIFK